MGKKEVSITTKTVTIAGILVGAVFSIVPALFVSPLSISEITLIPMRLWSLLLSALGLKKRRRPWGTVYDSITKQPLDPAYVVLKDNTGKEIQTSITDLDGRYGFLVEKGVYTLEAKKTDYQFLMEDKNSDELYQDLYHGEQIVVSLPDEVITKNIPMRPLNFNWNEFAKKQGKLMEFYSKRDFIFNKISTTLFVLGGVISVLALVLAPKPYNIVTFIIYAVLLVLRRFGIKPKDKGSILNKENDSPLSFAVIRIFSKATNTEMAHKVSDKYGRFYCLIPNGEYSLKIDKKLENGEYATVASMGTFSVTKGIINQKFLV